MTRWDYFPMAEGPCAPAVDVQGGWQITSYFGGRIDPIDGTVGTHGGQDLAYAGCRGAEIYAPSAGTLSQGWDSSGGGNWSGITLDDGSYCGIGHAADFAPGDPYRRVAAGELIAWCDSTGGSTGDHVHVAYRPAGAYSYADPFDILAECQHRHPGGDDDMPLNDDDLNAITSRVGVVIDNRIDQFATPNLLWQSQRNGANWEAVIVDGERCRRRLRPGEIFLLRKGAELAEQPAVNVDELDQQYQDAFYAWREV